MASLLPSPASREEARVDAEPALAPKQLTPASRERGRGGAAARAAAGLLQEQAQTAASRRRHFNAQARAPPLPTCRFLVLDVGDLDGTAVEVVADHTSALDRTGWKRHHAAHTAREQA
ncbi:unnamed protein product [Miscanthus lutarioriparius]|uniref:Uncharacterized protein n=1 Tax=Miscanthus lutarioriparius TaxID=422564 RepID=A0A811RRH8_9POAL|nr:unnamed protein product [Miscanthus lutarioriparius]